MSGTTGKAYDSRTQAGVGDARVRYMTNEIIAVQDVNSSGMVSSKSEAPDIQKGNGVPSDVAVQYAQRPHGGWVLRIRWQGS